MLLPEMLSEEIELVGEEGASSGLTSSRAWLSAFLGLLHAGSAPMRSGRTGDIDGGGVAMYTFFGPPL